jgi:hypothetical protein
LKELLHCYYSDVRIVCIPAADRPAARINQQYRALHEEIRTASQHCRSRRSDVGLLLNAEELEVYLKYAFQHFSKDATNPFDFHSAAFSATPIAQTVKDHIVKVAKYTMECRPQESGGEIFGRVASLVASSIFLDASRNRFPNRGSDPPLSNEIPVNIILMVF